MKTKLPAHLLEKYFAGYCNEQEKAEIQAWYTAHEQSPDDVSHLPEAEQQLFKAIMWQNINHKINAAESDEDEVAYPQRSFNYKSVLYWLSGVAAVFLVVFFVRLKTPQVIAPVQNNDSQIQTFSNTTNTIRPITLSDGSRVWVSPGSALTFTKTFEKLSRKVSLTGEAFFEVTKNPKRPFSISTGKVITKVWGTSFRIRAYAGDKTTKVDVVTGKVSVTVLGQNEKPATDSKKAVADLKDGVMLFPNQEAVYDKTANNLLKNIEIKDASIDMWKKASLSFNNTPLKDVFRVLNKSFNVNISSADDSINSDNLKADFTSENLPTILEILKKTLNVSYRVNGNSFVLESNK